MLLESDVGAGGGGDGGGGAGRRVGRAHARSAARSSPRERATAPAAVQRYRCADGVPAEPEGGIATARPAAAKAGGRKVLVFAKDALSAKVTRNAERRSLEGEARVRVEAKPKGRGGIRKAEGEARRRGCDVWMTRASSIPRNS